MARRVAGGRGCRWAYAKLGVMPPEDFMVAAAQQMQSDLTRTVPQDLSNSLWMSALPPPGNESCVALSLQLPTRTLLLDRIELAVRLNAI